MRLNFFLFLTALLQGAAAQSRIAAPALGYAYDPSLRAIRFIRGIPGAALLAEPLEIGLNASVVAVSPSQDFALAISTETQAVHLIRWPDGIASAVLLDGTAAPDGAIFSPSGRSAMLFDSASARLQLLTGLPGAPVLRDLPFSAGRAADALAVAEDGTAAISTGDSVRVVGPDFNSFSLPLLSVVTLAFDRSTRDLLAVTRSGEIYVAKNVDAGLDLRRIDAPTGAMTDPVGAQFSPDGYSALVASAAGITAIDLNTGSAGVFTCPCAPTALQPFGRAGLYRLTDVSDRPLFLFDADRARFWFVPVDSGRSAQ